MGAMSNSELEGRIRNAEKCLICYGPHSADCKEKGVSFELKNLKEVFIKSFGIQFLPHFSDYGAIHMCTRCHEEFLKVERIHDDLEGSESNFDAVREQFAFIVVDSVIKSQYINNYVHGNAFDAIRYLIFKEWGSKFRKQRPSTKTKLEKDKVQLQQIQNPNVVNKCDKTSISSTRKVLIHDEIHSLPVSTKLTPKVDLPSTRMSKSNPDKGVTITIVPNASKSIVKNKNIQSAVNNTQSDSENKVFEQSTKETAVEKEDDNAAKVVKAVETEVTQYKASQLSDSSEIDQECKSITSTNEKVDDQVVSSVNCKPTGNKLVSESVSTSGETRLSQQSNTAQSTTPTTAIPTNDASKSPPSSRQTISPTTQSAGPAPGLPQSTYILSPDGQKLISKCGKLPPKHKLIFVKRDPVTGKMVQVPKPNFSMVKGKLNGREVIVRSAPSSCLQNQPTIFPPGLQVQSVKGLSSLQGQQLVKSVSNDNYPTHYNTVTMASQSVSKILPAKDVITNPESPSGPRIVSVKSLPTEKQSEMTKPQSRVEVGSDVATDRPSGTMLETKSKSNVSLDPEARPNKTPPDHSKHSLITDDSKSKDEPEVRSIRSGRRIKRVYDSSSWASGHEMDQLVAQSLKDGRTDRTTSSPVKRHKDKSDSRISNFGHDAIMQHVEPLLD